MHRADLTPAAVAAALERACPLPEGPGHRYSGFAVLGLPFQGGDLLALRRFPSTSRGPGYTSVWHRDPEGRWTFYSDVPADEGCTRYFHHALHQVTLTPIRLEWAAPARLDVAVENGRRVAWTLTLARTPATRLVDAVVSRLPERAWQRRPVVHALGSAAALVLRAGRLRLTGRTPSGAIFLSTPRHVWAVTQSRAVIDGRDLGPPGALARQAALGEFLLPQRGLFAVGHAFMQDAP
jgi:hypothetical protein